MQLTFACPYTGKPIPSDILIDEATAQAAADYPISVFCPHCRFRHSGQVRDGQLVPESTVFPDTPPASEG